MHRRRTLSDLIGLASARWDVLSPTGPPPRSLARFFGELSLLFRSLVPDCQRIRRALGPHAVVAENFLGGGSHLVPRKNQRFKFPACELENDEVILRIAQDGD